MNLQKKVTMWFVKDFVQIHSDVQIRIPVFLLELKLMAEKEGIPHTILPQEEREFVKILKSLQHYFRLLGVSFVFMGKGMTMEVSIHIFNDEVFRSRREICEKCRK